MASFSKWISSCLLKHMATKQDLDRLYDQIAGHFQIQAAMQGDPVLLPLRKWAISPDAIGQVLAELQGRRAPSVAEFGSGQSTVILAAAVKKLGGQLMSVEHDADYGGKIEQQLVACGLTDVVDFRIAPLTADSNGVLSYSKDRLPERTFDIVLVDGPTSRNNELSRLFPLRWAVERLRPGGVVFLDDAARSVEQQCLKALANDFSGVTLVSQNAEKGLVRISSQAA